MVIIGVDPHKRTHTASALDPTTHRTIATLRIDAGLADYRKLLKWASAFEDRRWAVENARGLGRHLALWLIARGEQVQDVPSTATARIRQLSRGNRRKNDVIDASAAASVAALSGDGNPVVAEDLAAVMVLLDERRTNLTTHRTRLVNQLHALLRDLIPGGADRNLTTVAAAKALAAVRPVGAAETARKQLCRDLIAEIEDTDQRLKSLTAQIAETVAEHGTTLTAIDGVGPVIAARLLGRTRTASRFPTASTFANTPGSHPSKWPAPNTPGTGCRGPATANSTLRCT